MTKIENNPTIKAEIDISLVKACPFCNSALIGFVEARRKWRCYVCKNLFGKPERRERYATIVPKRKTDELMVITRKNLLHLINEVAGNNILRDRALISTLYLTGARVSEVVRVLHKYDISFVRHNEIDTMLIENMPILKRRKRINRYVPINMTSEKDFVKYIKDYIDGLEDGAKLFDISRTRAYIIVNKATGLFCHYFRHMRTTHLVTMYGLNSAELKQFIGWADDRYASKYAHLDWQHLSKKMSNAPVDI